MAVIQNRTLKYVFIISLVAAVLFPLLVITYISPTFSSMLMKNIEDDALRSGTYLADIAMDFDKDLSRKIISDDFMVLMEKMTNDMNLMKVKLFSPSGEVIYSSVIKDIGTVNDRAYFHDVIAKGKIYSKMVKKESLSLEGQIMPRDVAEIYVPVMKNKIFAGAVELYYDITEKNRELDRIVVISSLLPLVLMLVFLISIVTVLVRADREDQQIPEEVSIKKRSPYVSMGMIGLSIFCAEFIIMLSFTFLPEMPNSFIEAALDSVLLVLLISPTIYFFVLQPLVKNLKEQSIFSRKLEDKEARLSSVVETAHDAIVSIDSKGNVIDWNNAAETIFAWKRADIMGKPVSMIMPDNYRDAHMSGLERHCSDGSEHVMGQTVELEGLTRDGETFPLELSLSKWVQGDQKYFTAIIRDISDRKALEESLENERKQLEYLTLELEENNSGIERNREALQVALDEISRLILKTTKEIGHDVNFANPNLKKCYELKSCTKTECAAYGKGPTRCWQTAGTFCGGNVQGAFAQKYGDCSECDVFKEATSDPIYQIGEQFNNMMHVLEQKNQELEESNTELVSSHATILQQEKMASIGQLAAGVAHEINNPMGFISSNLSSLSKYMAKITQFINTQTEITASHNLPEAADEINAIRKKLKVDYIIDDVGQLIEESLDGADRVKKIVQNLKSFSRIDEADFKDADINECIESTLNIVWNEIKYKATVEKEYGELPPTKCYPQQLNQVFMNILVNAAHAIEKQGEIKIKTWNGDGSVHVSIADTGSGIPQEKLNRIFEPFYTTKDVGKGTGLGLSISYDIVKKHKGEITVDSKPGEGTTFTITIPVADDEDS